MKCFFNIFLICILCIYSCNIDKNQKEPEKYREFGIPSSDKSDVKKTCHCNCSCGTVSMWPCESDCDCCETACKQKCQ